MRKVLVAVFGACVLALCVLVQVTHAEGVAVCSTQGEDCVLVPDNSLEAVIREAKPGSVIELNNGVYMGRNIPIRKDLTIRGTDARQTIIQADVVPCSDSARAVSTTERVFEILGAQVNLENLTIRNGCAISDADDAAGGGIWASGDVTLRRVIMEDNFAKVPSAGSNQQSAPPVYAKGGAIFNGGIIRIEASTIMSNTALAGRNGAYGGGLYNNGSATVINSTISSNRVVDPYGPGEMHYGGGIYSSGTLLRAEYNSIVWNYAATEGGGLWSTGPVVLINNLFYKNSAPSGSAPDCSAPSQPNQAASQAPSSATAACQVPLPPGVKLTGITTDTVVPVYRPETKTTPRSTSIDFAPCVASQVRIDQLGNPRGLGGKCDLGAVDAAMSFLPTLWSAAAKPDLRIRSVTIDPPPGQINAGTKVMITVVVENVGNLATQRGFYIDLFINPRQTPPNQGGVTWTDLCRTAECVDDEGVIWLAPPTITEDGGVYTFKTDLDNDENVVRKSSKFDRYLPAGPIDIWVYADSYSKDRSTRGVIDELAEDNNQYHYPTFVVKPGRILPTAASADQQAYERPSLPTIEP